ncbi:hypothetical protein ACWCYL_04090 [Streptomyces sp. 900105755]
MTSKTRAAVTGAPGTREPCTARETRGPRETRDTWETRDTQETRDTRETREAPVPRAGDEERRPYRRVPPAAVRLTAVRPAAVPPGRRHTPEATSRLRPHPRPTPTGPGGGPLLARLPHLPLLLNHGGS